VGPGAEVVAECASKRLDSTVQNKMEATVYCFNKPSSHGMTHHIWSTAFPIATIAAVSGRSLRIEPVSWPCACHAAKFLQGYGFGFFCWPKCAPGEYKVLFLQAGGFSHCVRTEAVSWAYHVSNTWLLIEESQLFHPPML
jgi:hypothetical protein